MSYLARYLPNAGSSVAQLRPGARVDETTLLNLPGYYGEAYVYVFVEDTSARRLRRRRALPHPRLRLVIADCVNEIRLELDLSDAGLRANSQHKIETLIGALERFRDGLAAEAELYAEREQARRTRERQPA
jgi:hypothetical protein